ncbi:hypothetical protein [Streptomyces katrae]|uniref:hypothetical protein n=1 Tax=Streptomyces katrae TaxID=68223 RepID=UPI000A581B4E|nr:hypothetical protein [Streptomyces katrae]
MRVLPDSRVAQEPGPAAPHVHGPGQASAGDSRRAGQALYVNNRESRLWQISQRATQPLGGIGKAMA